MDIVKKAYTSRLLCTGNDVVPFYRNDYNNVVSKTNQDGDNDNIGNVLSFDTVNQCWCVAKRILRHQRDHKANCLRSDDLYSERIY